MCLAGVTWLEKVTHKSGIAVGVSLDLCAVDALLKYNFKPQNLLKSSRAGIA